MNEITIFTNDEFGAIRTTTNENGETLLCLTDVCKALDLRAPDVKRRLGDDVVTTHSVRDSRGRKNRLNFINEDGFYDVVLESRKPNARKFRKWVTSEVLPAIRKTGMYGVPAGVAELSAEIRQAMTAFTEFVRSQQLANQMMLEALQAFRENRTDESRMEHARALRSVVTAEPMFVVEVSIVPAGVRCVTDYLDRMQLGYTKQSNLRGSFQVLVVNEPIDSSTVDELRDIIRSFTPQQKWAKVKTIQI